MKKAKKTTSSESSLNTFLKAISESQDAINAIQKELNDHLGANPDSVNWAQAGSAQKLASDLKDICEFLGINN